MDKIYNIAELWEALGKQIEGTVSGAGGLLETSKFVVKFGCWTIKADQIMTPAQFNLDDTRVWARFVNRDGFKFDIYRNTILTGFGHVLGMQDVQIGETVFDDQFVVKSNRPDQVIALLSDQRLRELLLAQPDVSLRNRLDAEKLAGGFGEDADELHFEVRQGIWDVKILKGLFDIFTETLKQLVLIGSAYDLDPDVPVELPNCPGESPSP